ncbi:MAG: GIY-YIG nuclease family protein [Caldithrix sp.]|nr:GIY-YIG nuclease family protein [Caldithrix sp.]
MTYYVYAIYSPSLDMIYVGQTGNLQQRLHDHGKGYSKFTARANDWVLIYQESLNSRSAALKREKQLKCYRGRQFLRESID